MIGERERVTTAFRWNRYFGAAFGPMSWPKPETNRKRTGDFSSNRDRPIAKRFRDRPEGFGGRFLEGAIR
jgi:hypothetical protein